MVDVCDAVCEFIAQEHGAIVDRALEYPSRDGDGKARPFAESVKMWTDYCAEVRAAIDEGYGTAPVRQPSGFIAADGREIDDDMLAHYARIWRVSEAEARAILEGGD